MGTKLKRELAFAKKTPAVGKRVAAGSKRKAPGSGRARVTYRFDLTDIESILLRRISSDVIVHSPKPRRSTQMQIAKPATGVVVHGPHPSDWEVEVTVNSTGAGPGTG